MTYKKLVLEGFGCFSAPREFNFADGINTMSQLNETGKSTMLNGLVHTLFGLEKAGKDRFKSWAPSVAFRGELTLYANGATYAISMDFDRDKVSVAIYDEDTGKFTSHIREQSHVPAGTKSEKYMGFLQKLIGTVDVDVFRSAFVVDQPIVNEPELGEGWKLAAGDVGGAIEGAVDTLLARLGRDDNQGITRHLKDFGESRDMNKDRMLEKKKGELASLKLKLNRSVSFLDSIAPLIEKQNKVEEKIKILRREREKARHQKDRAQSWRRFRERWDSRNREYNTLKAEVERIKGVQLDRKQHDEDLAKLVASAKGPSMEAGRLEGLRRATEEIRNAAMEAVVIKKGYTEDEGLRGELLKLDVAKQEAEATAAAISAKAYTELEKLKETERLHKQWTGRYGEVCGISQEERILMKERLAKHEVGKLNLASRAQLIKYSPAAFIIVGCAVAYLFWSKYPDKVSAMTIIAGFAMLGFLVKGTMKKRGMGSAILGPEEEAILRGKLELLSDMDEEPVPMIQDGLETEMESLARLIEDARRMEKLAYRVSTALEGISPDDLLKAAQLANIALGQDIASLLGMDEAFWASASRENQERIKVDDLIAQKKVQLTNDDAVIASLMKGKEMTVLELENSLDSSSQQVNKIMSDWMDDFQDDPFLKVSVDPKDLAEAMEAEKKAEAEQDGLENQLEEEDRKLNAIRDDVREAKTGDIGNVPEIEECIDELSEEIMRLQEEAGAIQIAIRELREAGQDFSAASARILKTRITQLLESITGNQERVVGVSSDFKLSLSANGQAVTYEQLSQGTRDQLYICMRVAAAELLGEERSLPMLFDDSFGTTDSIRLEAMKTLFYNMSEARQFIILSHSHDIDGWGQRIEVTS